MIENQDTRLAEVSYICLLYIYAHMHLHLAFCIHATIGCNLGLGVKGL